MYKSDNLIYKYICKNIIVRNDGSSEIVFSNKIIVGVFGNMITKEMQTHMNYFRNAFKNEILQSQRNVFYIQH